MNDRAYRGLASVAVAVGAVEFILRAFVRTNTKWLSDLAPPYISAKLLFAGANPYDPMTSLQTWYAAGAHHLPQGDLASAAYSVYPPPTLLLIAPLALLRWQPAVYAFLAIGLLLSAAVVYGLMRLGWPQHRTLSALSKDPEAMFFLAFTLGFAPVHTAFHSLNIVLFACCAAILAVVVSTRATSRLPGHHGPNTSIPEPPNQTSSFPVGFLVAAGTVAAICFKPTTGIFLLPWLVRERRWRWLAAIAVACAVITALSLAPLLAHQGLSWLPDYRQNVATLFTHGGNADVSSANLENTDRIDLQLVAFAAFGNRTLASAIAAAVYVCLLLAFLSRAGWRKARDASVSGMLPTELPLLVASGCLALGLLPSYSRVYAAIVLLPLVLWCFLHLRFNSARWLLLLLSDFLLNTSAIVRLASSKAGFVSDAPRLWDLTIGGHTCWILLAIGCLLLYAVHQQTEEDVRHSVAPQPGVLNPAS